MLSKNQRQIIQKLQQKKFRIQQKSFVVEGKKNISEFLQSSFVLEKLFCTQSFWSEVPSHKICYITPNELRSISTLTNPDQGVAIFQIPPQKAPIYTEFTLVLDDIRDPGNLGTIIRLCDWFNVTQIVCSEQSVDCYNPKVVQATMGSLARVSIIYTQLEQFLQKSPLPIYASLLNGTNVYKAKLSEKAILVLGNEANGISPTIQALCQHQITIPQFGKQTAESLNVATASAILLSEFCRGI